MVNLQSIYENSKDKYNKCISDIRKKTAFVVALENRNGKKISEDSIIDNFDVILQYSLLQLATADYNFDRNEMIFIRDLTEKGDFVKFASSVLKSELTWDKLYGFSATEVRELLNNVKEHIGELSMVFASEFVAFEMDYVDSLEKNIKIILAGLATADGGISEDELDEDCQILTTINSIKRMKNLV